MILKFTEKLKKADILISNVNLLFGTNEIDFYFQDLSAVIEYKISLDVREWGIDGIYLNVENIELFANINIFKEDLNENEIDLLKSKGFKEYSEELILFNWRLSIKQNIKVKNSVFKIKQIMICELSIDITQYKDKILISAVVS